MNAPLHQATLQLSVDLALGSHQTALAQHRQLTHIALQLIERFGQHNLPATWGLESTGESAFADALVETGGQQELALLGDAGWLQAGRSRGSVADELQRRMEDAEALEITVTTLLMHHHQVPREHLATLSQHGIRVVRGAADPQGKAAPGKRHLTRHGIYFVPATGCLPVTPRWLGKIFSRQRNRHGLQRSLRSHHDVHYVIPLQCVLEGGQRSVQLLDQLASDIAHWRDAGKLRVESLAQMQQRRAQQLQSVPSRSVLRPAA